MNSLKKKKIGVKLILPFIFKFTIYTFTNVILISSNFTMDTCTNKAI